jgi:phage terminase large subunit-like protein
MANSMKSAQIANFQEFRQQKDRLIADKQLQDLIMSRRIAHDGNPLLRQHIDNANIKKYGEDGIRLVKRSSAQKIDAAVALSMAASRCLYYNLG